jgi:hypothetical protein
MSKVKIASSTSTTSLPARPIKTVAGSAASARFKGIGTMAPDIPSGLRRNEFQDRLLEFNETSKSHFSDDELAVRMDAEFPFGGVRIADRPELVQVIRKFYNAGTHGKQQQKKPSVVSFQYEKPKAAPVAADASTKKSTVKSTKKSTEKSTDQEAVA